MMGTSKLTDKYENFRSYCQKIYETEKSPRSLQAYWSLEFMKDFDKRDIVFSNENIISKVKGRENVEAY